MVKLLIGLLEGYIPLIFVHLHAFWPVLLVLSHWASSFGSWMNKYDKKWNLLPWEFLARFDCLTPDH